jgi:tetratricopeptide (TPR) repeat protein
MKKPLFILSIMLFIFTSCVSTPQNIESEISKIDTNNTENVDSPQNTENTNVTQFSNDSELDSVTEQTEQSELPAPVEENTNEDVISENKSDENIAPEVFIEPEVFDLEYTEPEIKNKQDENDRIILEPINEAELQNEEINSRNKTEANNTDNTPATSTEESITVNENTNQNLNTEQSISDNVTIDNSNLIDIENNDNQNTEELIVADTKEKKEAIIPSRSMTTEKGRYIDVSYPSSGWIYLGIEDDSKSIVYFGRKLGSKNVTFTLYTKGKGTKLLHFYKNDTLTGQYIDDYLEVTVLDEYTNNKEHVLAPEYSEIVPSRPKTQNATVSTIQISDTTKDVTKTAQQNSEQNNQNIEENKQETIIQINPADELQKAYSYFNEKNYELSLKSIDLFLNNSNVNIDEGLFLKGNILEAQSDLKNIKKAINAYEEITNNYPSSKFWDKANKRITYLKRFYMEGR